MISTAQTISLRFQSTWPTKDIFHEYAQDFAKKVNDMAGSRLKIEVLPGRSGAPSSCSRGNKETRSTAAMAWWPITTAELGAALWGWARASAWTKHVGVALLRR
jgi:hypothetical protein